MGISVTSVHPIGTDTDFFEVAQREGAAVGDFFKRGIHQSAGRVARTMVRGMERPRAEVWPMRPARWAVSAGTVMPGVVDWVMGRFARQIEARGRAG